MTENNNDHDLLISMKAEFSTKLDRVISDVKELKDNVADRVSTLEMEKSNKADTDKLDTRVSELEKGRVKQDAFVNNLKGKYAILAIIGMVLVSVLTAYITKRI